LNALNVVILILALLLADPPPRAADTITVTATRTETRLADTAASVVVLSDEELRVSAAATVDDALRQVPGFTLFRRSGSAVANPTSQGVTLRGIGASGASRALVLDDGIPLNDPFGGWIYWGRVPRVAIGRVEVLRGGASDLYGSAAMGGVVQFIRRAQPGVIAEMSGGSHETATGSLFAAGTRGRWRGSVAADLFTTGGWILVQPSQRGAVDVEASSRHSAIDATAGDERFFARLSHYRESRDNGTPLQVNDTTIHQLSLGFTDRALTLRAYGSDQDYYQTFSAVAADRASERLTVEQRVPSRGAGVSAQWAQAVGSRHALLAGAEGRWVVGTSAESNRAPVSGRQRTASAFVEDIWLATPALSITGGMRLDSWEAETSWSPRLSLLYRANDAVTFTGSAYRAFRAPTLNELYRGFRVGNVQTLANADLGAETLTAIEAGVRTHGIRATLFVMSMTDAIANVTLSTTPALITRQRQNIGSSRSRGLEVEGEWMPHPTLRASAGWLFVDATAGDKRVPQVPRHQLTAQLVYTQRITAAVQTRWSAMQFDDDLNELRLDGYFTADLFASVPLGHGLSATAAVENLFDAAIQTAATPVITLGQPRAFRFGLRYAR
jgi:outer membrane receptor protein involved in Fe transport